MGAGAGGRLHRQGPGKLQRAEDNDKGEGRSCMVEQPAHMKDGRKVMLCGKEILARGPLQDGGFLCTQAKIYMGVGWSMGAQV